MSASARTGPTGPAGPGVPDGGDTDQVLVKLSPDDGDTGWADQTGGGGGGAPSGPAGGVLSGTYPDPGFAADMATQAELDAEASTRSSADAALDTRVDALELAPPAHTHPQSDVVGLTAALAAKQDASTAATDTELASEASTRAAADSALDTRVDTLEASTTAADLAAHEADTTGVHGIADTSALVLTADARLSDARTPTDGSVTAAKVAASLKPSGSAAAGTEALRALGTSASTAAAGNDSRLSDSRSPTSHASSHAAAGSDPVTLAQSQVTSLTSDLAAKAPLASPALTGNPTAPTPTAGDNDTSVATTAFVTGAVGTEASARSSADALLAPLASPALTGNPTAPTQTAGNNSTRIATTAYVQTEVGLVVPKSLVDAKGDLLVGTANDTVARRAVGSNGQVLTADSAQSDGVKWAGVVGGGAYFRSGGYYPFGNAANSLTLATTASREYAIPFLVSAAATLDRLSVEVTTLAASSVLRVGIRSDSGAGLPGSVLLDAGTVDSSTTGVKELTVSQALAPGLYWATVTPQGGAPTVRATFAGALAPYPLGWTTTISTTTQSPLGYFQSGVTGALPGTFTIAGVTGSGGAPNVWGRFA